MLSDYSTSILEELRFVGVLIWNYDKPQALDSMKLFKDILLLNRTKACDYDVNF